MIIEIYLGDTLVYVEGEFNAGHPGRLYGPPERCYPPEDASFEIESARVLLSDGTPVDLCLLPLDIIADGLLDRIGFLALEEALANQSDDQEPDWQY